MTSLPQTPPIPTAAWADSVVMVRPSHFASNPQTLDSNLYQHQSSDPKLRQHAQREFNTVAENLSAAGIEVMILDDTSSPAKPDSVFPNNWFSTHCKGLLVIYPMQAENRRLERRVDELTSMLHRHRRTVHSVLDLSRWERSGRYLEGTGSMVLDRRSRVAYACLSSRTSAEVLKEWATYLNYRLVAFSANGAKNQPVYHTNVMMALGSGFAVLGGELIQDPGEKAKVERGLKEAGLDLIFLTADQVSSFCANLLYLEGSAGPVIALSESARDALTPNQRRRLEQHGNLVASAVPTIERYGGGGVRCMLAEVYLEKT